MNVSSYISDIAPRLKDPNSCGAKEMIDGYTHPKLIDHARRLIARAAASKALNIVPRHWHLLSAQSILGEAARPGAGPQPGSEHGTGQKSSQATPRISADIFSAIMIVGALVFPPIKRGKSDASTTRKPFIPWTRPATSATAISSTPILQVPTG